MMRIFGTFVVLMGLAACQPPLVSGSADSGVRTLVVGMPLDQVRGILGTETTTAQNPNAAEEKCVSWVYDETIAARYIHAFFVNDVLAKANDGHRTTCAYG